MERVKCGISNKSGIFFLFFFLYTNFSAFSFIFFPIIFSFSWCLKKVKEAARLEISSNKVDIGCNKRINAFNNTIYRLSVIIIVLITADKWNKNKDSSNGCYFLIRLITASMLSVLNDVNNSNKQHQIPTEWIG